MPAIFAVKALQPHEEEANLWIPQLSQQLKKGNARFGWSAHDIQELKSKFDRGYVLSSEEKSSWSHASFLLQVREGDYLVYINMPRYGQCSLVQATGRYSHSPIWEKSGKDDFRHVIPCRFVDEFDRNGNIVPPYLSVRLKLQGSHWRIYADNEFNELLESLRAGSTGKSANNRLRLGISDALATATESIRRNFPRKDLERLVKAIYEKIPGVRRVRKGPDWDGADLVIEFESGIPGLPRTETCAVQVKAYEGRLGYKQAIDDIKKAFETNPEYTCGLIVSTALELDSDFERELQKLREDAGKPVGMLLGRDLALALIKYHIKYHTIGDESAEAVSA